MNRFGTRAVMTAVLAGFLAGCTGAMVPLSLPVTSRVPQTRAASTAGVKQVILEVVQRYFAARDQNKNMSLTFEEAGMTKAEFTQADQSPLGGDGKLSLTEIVDRYNQEVYGAINQKALGIFHQLDTDANNRLSLSEFLKTPLTTKGPNGEPAVAHAMLFRLMDRNQNFLVDVEEFEDLIAWDTANLVPLPGMTTNTPVGPGPAPIPANPPVPVPQPHKPPVMPPAPPVPSKPAAVPPPSVPLGNPDSPPPERWY